MPWTVSDVNRHKKGLTDEEKKKWVKIANAALAHYLEKGRNKVEAEGLAIRTANASFGDKSKVLNFKELEKGFHLVLSEVKISDENDGFQLALPRGTFHSSWYGELNFGRTFISEMVNNQEVLKNTKPFLNQEHDRGKACAWAKEIRATDEGLEVKWEFTNLGKQLVEDNIYRYYSAEVGAVKDVETGEVIFPVFRGCALTNSPVMKTMSEVHLQDINYDLDFTYGGKEVEFSEIIAILKGLTLSEDQKKELAKLVGIDFNLSETLTAKEEVISSLNLKLSEYEEKIAEFEANKIEVKLSDALKAGKILPVDKEKWEKRLTDNFSIYSEIIDELPENVKFKEIGSELDDNEGKAKNKVDDFIGENSFLSEKNIGKGEGVQIKPKADDFI